MYLELRYEWKNKWLIELFVKETKCRQPTVMHSFDEKCLKIAFHVFFTCVVRFSLSSFLSHAQVYLIPLVPSNWIQIMLSMYSLCCCFSFFFISYHLADAFFQSDLQSYTVDTATSRHSGLSVLLKDTSTRAGVEPPTPWLKDGPADHWPIVAQMLCCLRGCNLWVKKVNTALDRTMKASSKRTPGRTPWETTQRDSKETCWWTQTSVMHYVRREEEKSLDTPVTCMWEKGRQNKLILISFSSPLISSCNFKQQKYIFQWTLWNKSTL